MTDRITYTDPGLGIDRDGNNNIRLTVWTDVLTNEAHVIVLNPGKSLDFLRNLANAVCYAAVDVARDIATGDCQTCGNTRLVKVQVAGRRDSNERCPACVNPYTAAMAGDFPPYPRIGGGVR